MTARGRKPNACAMHKADSCVDESQGLGLQAAFKSRWLAGSGSRLLNSKDPTVPCTRCDGFRVVMRMYPLSPSGKAVSREVWESSALSMIRSQGSSRFANQSFAAPSLGSLPPYRFASLEKVCFRRFAELASIQKTPQKLLQFVSQYRLGKSRSLH